MQFQVKFVGIGGWAINKSRLPIGLRGTDRIREELNCQLELDRISENVSEIEVDPLIEITEKQARKVGLFEDDNLITVKCAPVSLNDFLFLVVQHEKNRKTGEIVLAWLEQRIDHRAIWDAWSAAGFPLEWPPEEEEDE